MRLTEKNDNGKRSQRADDVLKSELVVHFNDSKSPDEATGAQEGQAARLHVALSDTWRAYYVKLLVLAQVR